MDGTADSQADTILASISGVLEDLTALEQSYTATKEEKLADLASHLQRLAETADTKAVRARVLRELYWHKRLPAEQIAKSFGLKQGEVRRVAGELVFELPCGRITCNNKAKFTFKSLYRLEDFEKKLSHPDGPKSLKCKDCEEHERRGREEENRRRDAERERQAEEQRRRAEGLATLPWPQFIETPEWVEARNTFIDEYGYACEVCKSRGVSLYVYLAKDKPQYSAEMWFKLSSHLHLLCADCIPRLAGLLEEQKYELVKKEFLVHIRDWARDNIQYPY
jgi:hypothetical protein